MLMLQLLLVLGFVCSVVVGREVTELHGANFELALTSYKYIAILFYDNTNAGRNMKNNWMLAAEDLVNFPVDCEIAQIFGEDPELKDLVDVLPSIRVFRRGIMGEYRGPADSEGMTKYIIEDAKPSVKVIHSVKEIERALENNLNTVIFSLFSEEDINEDESMDGYSIEAWGQYQAAADSLRGHAIFYVITSKEVMLGLQLSSVELPTVFMVSNEGEGILKYTGEILELNLSEWVLRNSSPSMGELDVSTTQGELYTTQFFSSRKLKFILFLDPELLSDDLLESWADIAESFADQAIFAYQTQPVADVLEYFDIEPVRDAPLIAAHNPALDVKYKSEKLTSLEFSALRRFVAGVVAGKVSKVIKSEPVPKFSPTPPPVVTAVGSNVVKTVSQRGKDVLLVVFAPWCTHCKDLLPTYEILGRAVQGESRIVIAKINGAANDIPASWGVKAYPTLLWFRASDKETAGGEPVDTLQPHPYWDAGYSLFELVGFVQRHSSFEVRSLRVASNEQLGALLGDEEVLRAQYELDERQELRNAGRHIYGHPLQDYLLGEVVFDGKRWHVVLMAISCLVSVVLSVHLVYRKLASKPKRKSN